MSYESRPYIRQYGAVRSALGETVARSCHRLNERGVDISARMRMLREYGAVVWCEWLSVLSR